MTEPFGTRVRKALCYSWRDLLRDLRVTPKRLAQIIGKFQGQLGEADSDPLWTNLDNLLLQRIAMLHGLRVELAGKVERERQRRTERRIRTKK